MKKPRELFFDAVAWLVIAVACAMPVMIVAIIARLFWWAVTGA